MRQRTRHGYMDVSHPDYEAWAADRASDLAQQRADGDPLSDADWDRLEAGPLWHTYPGQPS